MTRNDPVSWKSVPDYEGFYEVSGIGQIRNRYGKVLKPWVNQDGYLQIGLSKGGVKKQKLVHRLVCLAFYGPAPEGKPLALHGRAGKEDNSLSNLRWGSNSENMRDRRIDGTDFHVSKTHCPKGHAYDKENTYYSEDLRHRACITCRTERAQKNRKELLPDLDPRHGTIYGYSGFSCRCEPCRLAYSSYGKEWRRGKSQAKRSS